MEVMIPIVAIVSLFVALPAIIFGSVVAGKQIKLKNRELDIRERELALERERVEVLRLMEVNDEIERDEKRRLYGPAAERTAEGSR